MRNSLPEDGRLKLYGLALACVSAAFLLVYTTWPFLKSASWAPFIIAVVVSAWFGGYGPSLFAVVTSATVGQYFLFEPYGSFSPGAASVFRTLVFLILSLFVAFLVSSRRRAERVERAERKRFQATVTSIGDAVIATDGRGRVTFMNGVAEKLTAWPEAEAKGRPLEEIFVIVNEADRATVPNPVEKVLETGRTQGLANHTILIARDGTERSIDDSAAPITTDGGQLLGVVLVFHDITERKRAEVQLRDALLRLDSALDAGAIATWTWDIAADRVVADKNLARLFSVSPEDAAGGPISSYLAVIHPEDRERVAAVIAESTRTGTSYVSEYRLAKPDGSIRWVDARGKPQYDASGLLKSLPGVAVDITERKRAEALLIDQKHILELVAGGSPLSQVLDALCRMVEGHSGDTLFASVLVVDREGKSLRHGGAPSLPEAYNRAVDGIPVAHGVGSCGTAAFRREPVFVADIATDTLWVDFAELALSHGLQACWSLPILSGKGDVLGTFAMYYPSPRSPNPDDLRIVDLVTRTAAIAIERDHTETERKRAVEATVRRSDQLQRLAEISGRINAARDVNSVIGVVTEEARDLIGAKQAATSMVPDHNFPQPLNVVAAPPNPPREVDAPAISVAKLYNAVHVEHRPIRLSQDALATDPRWKRLEAIALVRPSGSGFLAAPLVGRNGKNLGLLQLADKEEGEFTEDDEVILLQLSRLAAIAIENARLYEELRTNDRRKDEFLAMLAHELRNPLAAIGNAVNVSTRSGLQEHIDWSMEVIGRQMKHLTRLIDDLMDVSRINRGKIDLRREVLDVTPILESAAATVRPLAEERKHTLEVAIDRGNLWARVDPTRLEQVVVNLLNNAAKYSENAGHIRLSAENRADELVISIRDKGVGILPEKLPQMFELFAQGDRTLARSEGGLGIGLTVVKKLVEMHDGSITAESEGLGKGSEFTIRLPAARRPVVAGPRTAGPIVEPSKNVRILVVDDNVDTAKGMARLLKFLGHVVSIAHDGLEAIGVAKEFEPEFVLLDIGLPGMDGYEVASRMREEACCKDAVIVAISGYGQDEDRRRSKEAGFDHHLIKPLDPDALLMLLTAGNGHG